MKRSNIYIYCDLPTVIIRNYILKKNVPIIEESELIGELSVRVPPPLAASVGRRRRNKHKYPRSFEQLASAGRRRLLSYSLSYLKRRGEIDVIRLGKAGRVIINRNFVAKNDESADES